MKTILVSFLLVFSIVYLGEKNASAQTENGKMLYVELSIPDEELGKVSNKFEVPGNFDFEKSLIGGGFATVDCIKCALASSYKFWIYNAKILADDKVKLEIAASFDNKSVCNAEREVIINPNKKETIRLKCGIKIVTYSAPQNSPK